MKNKKPKTIEKITRNHFRSFYHAIKLEPVLGEKRALELADTIVNSCSKQIKQLIADEVIGKDEFWADEYNTEGTSLIDVAKYKFQAGAVVRKGQLKKLERL